MDLLRRVAVVAVLLSLPSRGRSGGGGSDLHPVVLVPGYGSNRLYARLTAAYEPAAPRCGAREGKDEWFQLWPIDAAASEPAQAPCLAEKMSLVYDPVADDYRNVAGVVTRVPSFASTRALVGWDPLVRQLEAMGHRDGGSLFAAPYDFRYAVAPRGHPSAVGERYFARLTRLIERASRLNGGRPAVVVAHSFGCALTYQFLRARPLAWRQRFVKHAVLLAAALGGFAEGMDGLASGAGSGLPNLAPPARARLARSQQSALWRLPTPMVFGDRPVVVTKNSTYSANNITEFLDAIGFTEGVQPYVTRVLPMWRALPAPMVPVTSMYGVGVRTPETFVYGEAGFEGTPEVVYGDGDGNMNIVSLMAAEEWSGVEGQILKVVRLPGVSHVGFFSDLALKKVVAEIQKAVSSIEVHRKEKIFSFLNNFEFTIPVPLGW
ncbi:lecithin-cholesterol acyltransferase-like 1 isoform 2 precursor [Oryza sativa Japonica Group]|uniref:Lecithin-cholesterol acyltransferase-like 1 n=2 Tax=Oryza sativa subsp. japonica TaxID=39947 RepID=LCAT1_ORYSJ|nr:lecithin-cholesterol acyltransferase-like 1 isoform 2 [Oryza sativa Japonica Group]Q10PI6.1 RecName: Full=Lecithin-cholesterol acyltransferase-like 1 [Oryza sativa Japonica Group]KAB8090946.1 hypothetical protein EE612_016317 [Oryza sativa]ABF94810.1 Lecithin:cholesterol acyltransferase family protein, expressed [Oryza sativa Japonica Group]KAF2938187.1 hypothetical protein DAI22_03g100400 [Oryza sativa Japonica Group]BAS83122.1 Os03g0232800 [Oryza sativa Japonica Group]